MAITVDRYPGTVIVFVFGLTMEMGPRETCSVVS
jgi:hypothetical protein